jgi:L-asparaginase
MARVLVVGLGGTIAMGDRGAAGVAHSFTPGDLLEAVPGLAATGVDVETHDFRQLPGASLGFADLAELGKLVDVALTTGVDGVVVTQGTDTIEESAYYLDLHHRRPEPLVVTGAMRNPTLAGADGPANLLAAIQVAADPAARGRGCLVVFADEIHAASRVRKTHTTSLTTFRSPDGGALGTVVEGVPRFVNEISARFVLGAVGGRTPPPRVGMVTVALGDGPALLDRASKRWDGLVVAAFGAGHVPNDLVGPLESLARVIPVVLASRTGAGSLLRATYRFPGSESDLFARGLIPAGTLHPFKARVLLHALLATGLAGDDLRTAFGAATGVRSVPG